MDTKETARTDHLLEKVRLYMEKEKMAQLRRQRQEELGKTNRFTPVRAAQRKAEKPKGEKDGQP